MRNSLLAPLALSLFSLASLVHAQSAGTVTLSANQTTATGSLTPVITWSTSPVASNCVASGAWSGNKFASGTETLATITASKSYTLTCYWNNGSATLNWAAPTQNTDNSPLTDLAGFRVLYGTSASALSQSQTINDPAARSTQITALAGGSWYFAARAINRQGLESDNSAVVQKTIGTASAAKTVTITISAGTPTPTPSPTPTPTLKTTATSAYDVTIVNGVRRRGRLVGTVPLNTPCQAHYKVGSSFYKVDASYVKVSTPPRSNTIIARCALK